MLEEVQSSGAALESSDSGSAVDHKKPAWIMPRWLFRLRGVLAAPPVLAGLVLPSIVGLSLVWWQAGGALAIVLATLLRLWAQQHNFYRLKQKKTLATSGPYALTRNPFYIANAMLCGGAVAMCGRPWLAGISFVWALLVYHQVVRYEEVRLVRKYGAPYLKYLREVPRWLPRLRGVRTATMATGHLTAALRAEFHCLLLILPCLARPWLYAWLGV